jgi:predicted metal-dependent phosphoesterase TrpH
MTAFVDLHCHTVASFDSLSSPEGVVRAAAARGLTHLAITDHERIDGAYRARDAAQALAPDLTVILGEEVRTREGDLICLFLERAIPRGLSARETVAAAREQGGLVGMPHPFDQNRGSLLRDPAMEALAELVDWVETHNARVMLGDGNRKAAAFAAAYGLPGVAVSDAHTALEVGVAYSTMEGDPSTPAGLLAALATATIVPGRASYFVRLVTPFAKLIHRVHGDGRPAPASANPAGPS